MPQTLDLLCIVLFVVSSAVGQESCHALVEANTGFAFKLFRETAKSTPNENVVVAPAALSLDFALLQNGAGPSTKTEIVDAFGWQSLSSVQINRQSRLLREALSYVQPQPPKDLKLPPGAETGERLAMARSLWTWRQTIFKPEFLEAARKFFATDAARLPPNENEAVATINSWVSIHTGGKIDRVVDAMNDDDFLLIDTTWFKGVWVLPFSLDDTHSGDFLLQSGRKKSVPMMSATRKFSYLEGPKFQAIRLNYMHAAMVVFLPRETSNLVEFEQSLTSVNWASWAGQMVLRPGHLELPRFSADYRHDAKEVLEKLRLGSLSTSSRSLRKAVENPNGAKLTRLLQLIKLNVDEKGTEIVSAGVTGGVPGGIHAGQPEIPFRMIVNHPFFFTVVDNATGAILYMGAVVEP